MITRVLSQGVVGALMLAVLLCPGTAARVHEPAPAPRVFQRGGAERGAVEETPDLDEMLNRLARYLIAYEQQLNLVVAEERYDQRETRFSRSSRLADERVVRVRKLESEVAFLRLPNEGEWYGIRDIRKVDNKSVATAGPTLADILKNPTADAMKRAAAIVEASSRHNIGMGRTINMPTVPLEALSAGNQVRFIFKVRDRDRVAGVDTRRLDFEEFDEPTLVTTPSGDPLWSRGSAWIELDNGRLWRAELSVHLDRAGSPAPRVQGRLRVEFMRDAALDMLVPKQMDEEFWIQNGRGSGQARYSNFRRFGTSARIIPQ